MPSEPVNFAAMQATPMMASVGLSWVDIEVQVKHVLNLLQTQGETALEIVRGTIRLIKAVTNREMLAVFIELKALSVNIQALIVAIKAEFGIA